MKTRTLLALCGLLLGIQLESAQNTAFTYQGFLNNAGMPASGPYDLQFRLYGSSNAGPVLSSVLTMTNVAVSNGLFSLALDFGAAPFNGQEVWLNVAVRNGTYPPPPPAPSPYVNLDPRVKLGTVPYAVFADSAATVASNGVTTLSLQNSSITAAKIASGNVVKSLNGLTDFVTLSAGSNVTVTSAGSSIFIGTTGGGGSASNAWLLLGNAGTTAGANFLGTTDNQPVELKANSQRALRLEPNLATSAPNVIGGSIANAVDSGAVGATIGGGGALSIGGAPYSNRVSALFGVIGGGGRNTIQTNANSSTIAGGVINTIQSSALSGTIGGGTANTLQTNAVYATIGGGTGNTVQTGSRSAAVGGGESNTAAGVYNTIAGGRSNSALGIGNTVGGGSNNVANGNYGTISGGEHNTAGTYGTVVGGVGNYAGYSATVVGGRLNTATGDSAVAMGNLASATHTGSFVYSDYIGTAFASTADNQFSIRAGGGVRLDGSTSMSFGATRRQMLNLYTTDFGFGVQDNTLYSRIGPVNNAFAWYAGGIHSNNQTDPGAGGTRLMLLQREGLLLYQGLVLDVDELNTTGDYTKGLLFGGNSGEGIVSKRSADFANSGYGLDFYANRVPRMTIQNGGNVGIGTQSPGARLDVIGTVRATAFVGDGSGLANLPGGNFAPSGTPQVGAVVTASDVAGHVQWSSEFKALRADRYSGVFPNRSWTGSANLVGGSSYNAVNSGVIGATLLGGGSARGNPDTIFPPTVLSNFAGADFATVLGGQANVATASYASTVGGRSNVAAGQYSLAVGQRAKANHNGAFVWADSQNADFASTANDEFSIRAANGVHLNGGGPLVVDADQLNTTGDYSKGLIFGEGSGEGIVSKRVWDPGNNGYGLDFYANGQPRMTIQWGGSVGIGTQSPTDAILDVEGDTHINDHDVFLRADADRNHGLGWYGSGKPFAGQNTDGPVLYGWSGGALGSTSGGQNVALRWNQSGMVSVKVLEITGGADLAEPFRISGSEIAKGALVVIDEDHPGQLKLAEEAYDHRVAGIVSGANGVKPGITLHQEGKVEGGQNVALSGRVYALADASEAPIKPGDLLTSSATPGHVMKVTDPARAHGAIVGKAMSALKEGKGTVLVLVSLQ